MGALQIVQISVPALIDGAEQGRDAGTRTQLALPPFPASSQPTPSGPSFPSLLFLACSQPITQAVPQS